LTFTLIPALHHIAGAAPVGGANNRGLPDSLEILGGKKYPLDNLACLRSSRGCTGWRRGNPKLKEQRTGLGRFLFDLDQTGFPIAFGWGGSGSPEDHAARNFFSQNFINRRDQNPVVTDEYLRCRLEGFSAFNAVPPVAHGTAGAALVVATPASSCRQQNKSRKCDGSERHAVCLSVTPDWVADPNRQGKGVQRLMHWTFAAGHHTSLENPEGTAVATEAFEEIADTFEFLDDWEERYRHVIDLGKAMEPLEEAFRVPATKVDGCASQVWLLPRIEGEGADAVFNFRGESDAMIVRGLIAVLIALYSGLTVRQVLSVDASAELARLGLNDHLSAQRSNGLRAMVERIRLLASDKMAA